ncbi:hypothetical protein G6O69_18945 [Pseudenhygromyxa sp. WMMC2535]|uniref:hypothetical protein n=1 Tax=Pseudenhygromyxa sp. WMMC2535 TaxID=2712867 RepID=UPI00155544F9|nr:hypothetical protein [Pseudenhygromyxa sp. WMMC2535]NVB39929.1 hypothetical protein [Pseudenhygromyxa sp. WMMC2535]
MPRKAALELDPARALACVTAIALVAASSPALAAPSPGGAAEAQTEALAPGSPADDPAAPEAGAEAGPETEGEAKTEPEGETEQPEVEVEAGEGAAVEVDAVEPSNVPSGGGVAGAIVDPDDPNATRAQSDLEGESLDDIEGVPARLPPLQAAGWWTVFAGVTLATAGGVFAGIAETREDAADRMAYSFSLTTGATTLYADVADDYERTLREGEAYQWAARGLIIAGGVVVLTGLGLFIAEGVRHRRAGERAAVRVDPGPGGLRLRF